MNQSINAVPSNTNAGDGDTNTSTKYFDLHVVGIGYLNRARVVPVKKSEFVAVDVSALRGSTDDVEYTRFDCRVNGSDAEQLVRQLMPHIENKKKVLVGFRIGDIYPETFTYSQGERAGQIGVSLKGRLLRISWAKVDGLTVYSEQQDKAASTEVPVQKAAA